MFISQQMYCKEKQNCGSENQHISWIRSQIGSTIDSVYAQNLGKVVR